ncbi:tetratricopeptide repeat protein [Stieleria varia]|uniref:Tetratricopeptide repeat protein n=1 Tax=Stieleria varia TaxID=2528005 RepID=A0A5C6A3N8_9BACT|nr:hypothetical protein [Stieleria varia]TWT93821.1 hypothetical protein Pla52n_56490 [Stieleria varia]
MIRPLTSLLIPPPPCDSVRLASANQPWGDFASSDDTLGAGWAGNRVLVVLVFFGWMFLSLAVGLTHVSAQESQSEPDPAETGSPSQSDPVTAENLAKDDYASRQRATMQLWRDREHRRQEVQDASRHPDPEVAQRANWILRQWRRGAVFGSPIPIEELDDAFTLQRVLDAGEFRAVQAAVEESAGTVDYDQIKKQVAKLLSLRFPFYAKHAVDRDNAMQLLELVNAVCVNQELAVCRISIMQMLGVPINDDNLLPQTANAWSEAEKRISLVQIHCLLGQHDQALPIAVDADDRELKRVVRMLMGQWQELAADSKQDAENADEINSQVLHWAWTLVAADRSNNDSLADEACQMLAVRQPNESFQTTTIRWKALALHGRIDEALALLREIDPNDCASVALAASRPSTAMDVLGYPYSELDANLDQWLTDAIVDQVTSGETKISPAVDSMMTLIGVLLNIGRTTDAWMICERLNRPDLTIGMSNESMRDRLLRSLLSTPRTDWVAKLAAVPGDRVTSFASRWWVAESLGVDEETLRVLLDVVGSLFPTREYPDRFSMVCQLIAGELPEGFDADRDFERIYERLSDARRLQPIQGRIIRNSVRMNQHIVDMFSAQQQFDIARRALLTMVAAGDIEAAQKLAEIELQRGNHEAAEQLFDKVWQLATRPDVQSGISVSTEKPLAATKALVGQWILAKRAGDTEAAERLLRQLRLTLCSPSTDLRNQIAEYLRDQDESALASEVLETLVSITAFGSSEATEFYDVARNYSAAIHDTDVAKAASWFDLAVGGTLETTNYRATAYISLPLFVRRWMLESAIKDADAEAAKRHIERIELLDPLNIDFAERLLPELREASLGDLADEVFDRLMDRGLEYVKVYAQDATTLNNLAWSAAMNKRRLDEALELSQRSVYWEPDSAIYRDTLAEILFSMGRSEEALLIEQACLLDDPEDWHFHTQVEKYRAAIKD